MNPNVVAAVFARGGSKGVPRKNLRLLGGKSLLAHAIESARGSAFVGRVIVSTDDPEIAAAAAEAGAEVPFLRPAELAGDNSPEWLAWQHALRALGPGVDVMVSVPTTSPLRATEDIDACIRLLLGSDSDVVLTVKPAERSPYFNMVGRDAEGLVRPLMTLPVPVTRRQDAPPVFDLTTVAYAVRPGFVLSATGMFQGRVRAVVVPTERALDIDTELDLAFAEFLLQRQACVRGLSS
jgi:N-acylneuraminate cytidylyltransferase